MWFSPLIPSECSALVKRSWIGLFLSQGCQIGLLSLIWNLSNEAHQISNVLFFTTALHLDFSFVYVCLFCDLFPKMRMQMLFIYFSTNPGWRRAILYINVCLHLLYRRRSLMNTVPKLLCFFLFTSQEIKVKLLNTHMPSLFVDICFSAFMGVKIWSTLICLSKHTFLFYLSLFFIFLSLVF